MSWLKRFWRSRKMEEQLDRELRFHLEQHAADLRERGDTIEEAARQARLALGGSEQVKEQCRDARGTRWLEDLLRDLRYTSNGTKQKPGFAAVVLVTLALGVGATTALFTLIHSVLLKPLPFPQPERLVAVHGRSQTWNVAVYGEQNLAYLDFRDCQQASRSLALAGWLDSGGTVSGGTRVPEYVDYFEASANLFSVLGAKLFRGRAFTEAEDKAGGTPIALLGYSFWQRRFGGSAAAIGTSIVLDEKQYSVVGIADPGFRLGGEEADVYTPLGQDTAEFLRRRQTHPITVVGRVESGATMAQAQGELAAVAARLAAQFPDSNKDRSFKVDQLRPDVEGVGSTLWLLFGGVCLVLLIACANIASLLLARAVSREREFAMRAALGASRSRLVRQCLTESGVLALVGGLLGVLIAGASVRALLAFWPGELPRANEVQLDWPVLLFALTVSLTSGLFFGLAPAIHFFKRELEPSLRAGARTVVGQSRHFHTALVVAEMALAVVLLASVGMLGNTILRLSALDPGVNVHNVLVTRVALPASTLANPARTRAVWNDILERARNVSGVRSVAMVDTVPMREGNNQLGYWTNAAIPPENRQPMALTTSVTPDYLKVMGISLLAGRFVDEHDQIESEPVIVIDDVMARHEFGGAQSAVGRQIWVPDMGEKPLTIVGVVRHVRYWGLAGDDRAQVRAQFYYPFAQVPDKYVRRWSELMSVAFRTDVSPLSLVERLRHELRGASGGQVLYDVHTMEQLTRSSLSLHRFLLWLFGIFAGLALLLASIGIYGVLAYLTNHRVPEIGLRMALGASGYEVMAMVMGQSLRMILWGGGLGLCGAFAAAEVLRRSLEGMRPAGTATYVAIVFVLLTAAFGASFLPAYRASRVDPVRALRED